MEVEEEWLLERLQDNAHMRKQVKELQECNNREVERRRKAVHELDEQSGRLGRFEGVGSHLLEVQDTGGLQGEAWSDLAELMMGSKLGFHWNNILAELEKQSWEVEEDFETRRLFVGTVMSLTPSGKFYTPWANSNVEVCESCGNNTEPPCDDDIKCTGSTGEPLTGDGHCEVCRDAAWREQFELEADRHGMFLESGEGDPCDLFVCQSREVDEDEKEVDEAFESHDLNYVFKGAAAAFFVSAWGDKEEEAGRSYPGKDLMDVAPDTPDYVMKEAYRFIGALENANKRHIASIFHKAIEADVAEGKDVKNKDYPDLFGHYLAMEAMGHGVSWWDDHAKFEIVVPHVEFTQFDLES